MATVFHIVQEEYERLLDAEKLYLKKIDELPKGRPRTKKIRGNDYLYLNRREGQKIIDEYVGRADGKKAQEVLKLVEKREQLIHLLKEVRTQLSEIKKVLRGKI